MAVSMKPDTSTGIPWVEFYRGIPPVEVSGFLETAVFIIIHNHRDVNIWMNDMAIKPNIKRKDHYGR